MLLHLSDHSPEPLRSQVARQLRARILRGDLEPGSSVPAARPLARSHHVGVATVAAALDELREEGLLVAAEDGEYRVAELTPSQRRALADQALSEDPSLRELSLAELQLARDIQCRLLPPPVVLGEGYATIARCFPARFVAGDLYDVIPLRDGSVGVVVADVAGKGFAAALLMASVKAMTPFVAASASVEGTLAELNRRLLADLGPREFVALAYARYWPDRETVTLANAGMPDPLLLTAGKPPQPIEAPEPRLALGLRPSLEYRAVSFTLRPGQRLLMYSDGLPEARLRSGEPLGYEEFGALVGATKWDEGAADQEAVSESMLDALLAALQERTGPTPDDDCTAVILQHRGNPGGTR